MTSLPVTELTQRARDIFQRVVEEYIASGQPVGSKTLAGESGLNLSPASIRSVLHELETLGLLAPCLVAYATTRPGWHRLVLVAGAAAIGNPLRTALAALVEDGFAILKVGPGLTFALREALYGLDAIAETMFGASGERVAAMSGRAGSIASMEIAMVAKSIWPPSSTGIGSRLKTANLEPICITGCLFTLYLFHHCVSGQKIYLC